MVVQKPGRIENNRKFDKPPHTTTFTMSGGGSGIDVRSGDSVEVIVEWYGKEERFFLEMVD